MDKLLEEIVLVNCTPHDIKIVDSESYIHRKQLPPRVKFIIPISGNVARVSYKTSLLKSVITAGHLLDITTTAYGEVEGLPSPEKGVQYVVSKIVAEKLQGKRDDLLILSGLLRKPGGAIIGGRSLAKFSTDG